MAKCFRVLLVGRPMYDPLYARLGEFGEREGVEVGTAVAPSHPELNERIEEECGSGAASYDLYDLISTHAKYARARDLSTRAATPSRYRTRPVTDQQRSSCCISYLSRIAGV